MSEELFRKKSLDRIKTPEKIDAYIQAERTRYGLILIALAILALGITAWFFLGSLEMKISTIGVVDENGFMTAYISEEDATYVEVGMKVVAFSKDGKTESTYDIDNISENPTLLYDDNPTLAHLSGLTETDWCYEYTIGCDLDAGQYEINIVTNTFHPFQLLFAD